MSYGFAFLILLGAAMLTSGCRTTVAGQSVWIRPALSFAPRSVEVGDGEQVVIPGYEPRGDSLFVVVRVFPEAKKNAQKLTGSNIREWPKKIKNKISGSTD